MDKQAEHPVPASAYGKELLQSALFGAGVTASGASLYHLLNGLQSARVPELLRNEAPAAIKPKTPAARKKRPALKMAGLEQSATQLADKVFSGVGNLIPTGMPAFNFSAPQATGPASPNMWHEGYRNTANLLAAGLGGYGGLKLVSTLADQKKKDDLEHEVDNARKEYFAALTGKQAAILDAAYDELEKTSTVPGQVWTTALLAALGSGSIGATYMYNQTKARSKAENVQRAAAARARLRGLQQTPWVDPEQLATLAQNK
jgi:hypothetical protein